jgi:glycosyltransferase involved in cell wall biosynthesis
MHILFISQYFFPEIGAASERISGFSSNLCMFGHKVTVITGFPNYPLNRKYPGYRKKLFSIEEYKGVRLIRVWLFTSSNSGAFARLLNYLSFMFSSIIAGLFVKDIDYTVATSGPIFAGLAGYILSVIKRAAFIFDVRDIWPERIYAGTSIKRGPLIRMLEKLEIFLYRKASRIIAVTRGVSANIISKGIDREKTAVITNGVDAEVFKPQPKDQGLAEKLGIRQNNFVVIYAGTLGLLQDNDLLLAAAEKLKNYSDILFLVIGGGAKRDEFIAKAKKDNLDKVLVLPPVSPVELCRFINLSDVGVNANTDHPHNNMAIPVKMFTYMACAKPVILANSGEIAELVESHNIGRCVPPGDVGAFSNAILEFYHNRGLCKEYGRNCYELAQNKFSIERLSRELDRVLLQV